MACSSIGSRDDVVSRALAGAAAGTVATVAMSGVMLAAQRAGWMGKQPPRRIVEASLDAAGARRSETTDRALALAAHLGYGAVGGAVFAPLVRRARGVPALGIAFALAVWAGSYFGWVPALGIMPPAHRDHPGRQPAMVLAHVVYGGVLGWLVRRVRPTRRAEA
jgi:hypothetical protein